MVIGLVSWVVSVGLIIVVVTFAVRNGEMSGKISKCYVIESVYMHIFNTYFIQELSVLYLGY